MANKNVVIIGLTGSPVFGVPDMSTWGAGQSLSIDHNGDTTELKDGTGNVIAAAYYNNNDTANFAVKIKSETYDELSRGMILKVDNIDYILTDWSVAYAQGDFMTITLNCKKYELITVTAGA